MSKWAEFVKEQNIGNVKLVDYYNTMVVVELVTELFCDLVAAGAITLPSGAVPSDFDFDVRNHGLRAVPMLMLKNKTTEEEEACVRYPHNVFTAILKLRSYGLQQAARSCGYGVSRSYLEG